MKSLMKSKVSVASEYVIPVIIITVTIAILLFGLPSQMSAGERFMDEAMCRSSVIHRARNPAAAVYSPSLSCKTTRVDVGEERASREKEAVMEDISELAMGCWGMFGSGVLRSLDDRQGIMDAFGSWVQGANPFGIYSSEALCFVCYDIHVDSIQEDGEDTIITEADILSFMENTIYVAEGAPMYIDEDSSMSPCQLRGGRCSAECSRGEISNSGDDWACDDGSDVCCVSRQDAFSYMDYLRYDGPARGIVSFFASEGTLTIEDSERYGIVYVEPIPRDASSYIMIANMDDVADSGCTINS